MRASDDNDDWLGRRTDRSVTSGASGGHGGSGASDGQGIFFPGGHGRSGSSVALVLGPATQTRGIWPPPKKNSC